MNNEKSYKELMSASYLSFQYRNDSIESTRLFEMVSQRIRSIEVRTRQRKSKDEKIFNKAIEVILSSLMIAISKVESRWAYRGLCSNSFDSEIVKVDTFKKVLGLMESADFIEIILGNNRSNPFQTDKSESKPFFPGLATRFRVTGQLLYIASNLGIFEDNIKDHYRRCLPTNVIKKRAKSIAIKGKKISGRQMNLKKDAKIVLLEQQIKNLNKYLSEQHLDNAIFSGYIRTFNMGDQPEFNWNKGGRISCPGNNSYQKLKKIFRLKNITLNNESIAEVDINASYLSIFYGLIGYYLPAKDDLYEVPGLHREIVKAWITAAFGQGVFPTRWPSHAKADLIKKNIDLNNLTMKKVGHRICEAIPVLKHLPKSKISWADLMNQESQAIILAMESLRDNFNIPAYSMHDGLIVPVSGKNIAANEIIKAFGNLGLECRVKIEIKE